MPPLDCAVGLSEPFTINSCDAGECEGECEGMAGSMSEKVLEKNSGETMFVFLCDTGIDVTLREVVSGIDNVGLF